MDINYVPQHIAIIMDGNGRWAKERGLPRIAGHNEGMNALTEVVRRASDIGVKYLTVYAFSTENWKRPEDEVSGIFKLLIKGVASKLQELHENNVIVNIIGDWSVIPEDSKKSVVKALETTKNNTGLKLNIALNYGGRAEIVRAVKSAIESGFKPCDISEESFSKLLYTADMPDPDLIIRTGGEMRLSNFLTWQSAYSELYVVPTYWPDFTPDDFEKAIEVFQNRDRRFGGVK